MAHVLVVDDDPRLVKAVAKLLRQRGYAVQSAFNGELAHQLLRRGDIDIALVDVNLPGIDGLSLVHQLREERNAVPLILLTARASAQDQALGLRLGCDDYIAKPFNPEVLLARIHAVLRRCRWTGTTQHPVSTFDLGPIRIDLTARQVYKNGMVVRLAPMEYAILEFLVTNRGRAVAKDEILLHAWGTTRTGSRTLPEHVSRLRRKLGDDLILTQNGYGYFIPATQATPTEATAISG